MRLPGRAFTILYRPSGKPSGTVGDYIDDVLVGSVVVLDNGGNEHATVWGDILTWVANQRRVQVEAIGGGVNIGDARCEADDPLRGDSDGVVAIPKAHEEEVLTVAEEIDAIEQRIRDAVKTGQTLVEARRLHGYHSLQTRKT